MSTSANKPKYNPYDFANPVTDKNLFSGRKKQQEEIRYYLQQAAEAPRPINLALLGNRAAGKTSLLNMIALEAKERGFCVVRIDLNEGDVENQLVFFYKLFDGIFSEACDFDKKSGDGKSDHCFGGKAGKTYDAFLDMTSAYEIPEDKIWSPFIFPVQYAKAMNKSAFEVKVSDANIKKDLELISKEVSVPIAILFDECNVLSSKRILLEMIRNVFMNLPGYMLIFTGTADLFPVMDDVFSPIVRQFKRIDIESFVSWNEIRECIVKPLKSIGVEDISEVIDVETFFELSEIRSITGGKPYEIQLLCHFMYKRCQNGLSDTMKLSLDVFDDVIKELARGKDLHSRSVITKIQEIDDKALKALRLLASCCGKATFDDLWVIEYLLFGEARWVKNELAKYLQYLVDNQILTIESNVIKFAGDDFDKIYSKYYAKQHKHINLSINDYSQDGLFRILLDTSFSKHGLKPLDVYNANIEYISSKKKRNYKISELSMDLENESKGLTVKHIFDCYDNGDCSSFTKFPMMASNIYWILNDFNEKGNELISIINVIISSNIISADITYYFGGDGTLGDIFISDINNMKLRAISQGIQFEYNIIETAVTSTDSVIKAINKSAEYGFKEMVADAHINRMVDAYFKNEKSKSKRNADIALAYNTKLDPQSINNTGYIYLTFKDYKKAHDMFTLALNQDESADIKPLALYNLGVVEIHLGSPLKSIEHFTKSIDLIINDGYPSATGCIYIPADVGGEIVFTEIMDANLVTAARQAIDVINSCAKCG